MECCPVLQITKKVFYFEEYFTPCYNIRRGSVFECSCVIEFMKQVGEKS